jgi:hypothetical protein
VRPESVFKVSDFVSWQKIGSLELSPAFQRRPVWPVGAKSFLIDTVLSGIPMPIVFIRERSNLETLEPIRQVVDGQQRLRTLISFIDGSLLKDFKPAVDAFVISKSHSKALGGKGFADLEPTQKQAILGYEFSVHVLPSDTEDRDVLKIFARMNSTGYKLNGQELRNAEFFGQFKNAMYELAYEQLPRWRRWHVFSETDIARMIEVEETSDIVITMMRGLHGKNGRLLDNTYRLNDETFAHRQEIVTRFRAVMDAIDDSLGGEMAENAFRRKALFNTLATFYYAHLYGLKSTLNATKPHKLSRTISDAVRKASAAIEGSRLPARLSELLRGATAHLESRTTRLKFLEDQIGRV